MKPGAHLTLMPYPLMAIVLLLILSACRPVPETDADRVTYRLKWLFNVSTAGDLYADQQGIFQAYGLEVTVKSGGPERDAIKELELGQAQFGVASADQVIRALNKGSPLVVIAQLFQINPLQWIYRANTIQGNDPINTFTGKTIGVTFGGNDETIMRTLLAKYEIHPDSIELYSVRYDYTPFYRHQVDFWPVYINAQGPLLADRLAQAGEATAFFDPHAAGVSFVANSVVTTQRLADEQPDLVRRFREALMEGWRQALDPENEETTLAIIRMHDRDTPPPIMARQLAETRHLMLPHADSVMGAIDQQAWQETEIIMLTQGIIEQPVGVQHVLWPINQVYRENQQ